MSTRTEEARLTLPSIGMEENKKKNWMWISPILLEDETKQNKTHDLPSFAVTYNKNWRILSSRRGMVLFNDISPVFSLMPK